MAEEAGTLEELAFEAFAAWYDSTRQTMQLDLDEPKPWTWDLGLHEAALSAYPDDPRTALLRPHRHEVLGAVWGARVVHDLTLPSDTLTT